MTSPNPINNLQTPCLLLDQQKLTHNITQLHHHLAALNVTLRPHGKTAKSIHVMRMALAGQQGGITVSTLKEADYYFAHGIHDIVYAVGITANKLPRIATLINKGAQITLVLDSIAQAQTVAEFAQQQGVQIPALIEIDCDGHRSGVKPNSPLLLDIAHTLHQQTGVQLAGVLTHAGESYLCQSRDAICAMAEHERATAVACAQTIRDAHLPCPIVSVGSTPTAIFAQDLSGVTEVRAGVFVFYDLVMADLGVCALEDIGLSVLTSVIGHQPEKGWIITDAGWTALSMDPGTAHKNQPPQYGLVCDSNGQVLKDMVVASANQEHGIIQSRGQQPIDFSQYPIGRLLRILPNHACATASMHSQYEVLDTRNNSQTITAQWPRISGW